MLRSVIAICLLMMPLTGCVGGLAALFRPVQPDPVIVCPPKLATIPDSAVDALVVDGRSNPETGQFLVSLEKQYQYQDVCAARHG